jgi:protein involved in polysaccharide export with SLBB domain
MHLIRHFLRFRAGLLCLVTLTVFTGCEPPSSGDDHIPVIPATPPPSGPTGIQPGESLDIFVMEDDSFSGTFDVRSTGHVIMPKLGRVKVGGLSAAGAESAIKNALEGNILTQATVLVDRPSVGNAQQPQIGGVEIFLSGKVTRPGRYRIVGIGGAQPTVHQAILQAGGCSRFAHRAQTHILRRKKDGTLGRINADLEAIETGRSRDVALATGDIVVVPEKMIDFGL